MHVCNFASDQQVSLFSLFSLQNLVALMAKVLYTTTNGTHAVIHCLTYISEFCFHLAFIAEEVLGPKE